MKKTFRLEDLDCAHCAARMEEKIKALGGVISAEVNFLAQQLVLEAEDDKWDAALKAACEAVRRVDGDCSVIVK